MAQREAELRADVPQPTRRLTARRNRRPSPEATRR